FNPLVWHAAYPDSDGVMQAQLIGSGTPTFNVDAGLLLPDYQGVYVAISEDTPPWHGARWSGGVAYGTDGSGDPLDPLPSLYGAPSYTNSLTYSSDLTNAAWVKSGTGTAALDAAGLTGAPNTATTITDSDSGGETKFQNSLSPITANTNTHTVRFFLLKDSNTTRFPELGIYINTACRAFIHFNTQTGAITEVASRCAGTFSYEANVLHGAFGGAGGWEVLIQITNANYTSFVPSIEPAGGSVAGTISSTVTGSCVVGNVEAHFNKTIAQVRGSSPILTAASTVTTTAITDVHDSGNWVDTSGGLYCEVTLQVAQNILSTFLDVSGSTFRLNDGTNTATAAWVTNTAYQLGIAWDASAGTMAINVDGTWSSNATYDGTLLAGALDIFRSPAG
ncbi:hypothetical protein KDA14_05865, partial [Candidatus Saccharibacteria bacterium]|nr:hypothetical protein [Candidatus Saccharibacteria bacterium]